MEGLVGVCGGVEAAVVGVGSWGACVVGGGERGEGWGVSGEVRRPGGAVTGHRPYLWIQYARGSCVYGAGFRVQGFGGGRFRGGG